MRELRLVSEEFANMGNINAAWFPTIEPRASHEKYCRPKYTPFSSIGPYVQVVGFIPSIYDIDVSIDKFHDVKLVADHYLDLTGSFHLLWVNVLCHCPDLRNFRPSKLRTCLLHSMRNSKDRHAGCRVFLRYLSEATKAASCIISGMGLDCVFQDTLTNIALRKTWNTLDLSHTTVL
jgi:hypothetical protein